MSKTSHPSPGVDRVTTETSDFFGRPTGSQDRDYKDGKCIAIVDHDTKGESTPREVGHGWFGPFAGGKK